MAWYNPLSWGQREAEKYDPNSERARAARTMGGPNRSFDIRGEQASGAQLETGQADAARRSTMGLADTINRTVQGGGPSAAGMAAAASRDANLAQAAALSSGRRGQGAGSALRMGMNSAVAGNLAAGQSEAVGRANEMAQARGELGNVLSNVRGQDLAQAGQNAQLRQSTEQFNAGQRQNASLANQAAQLGISQQEMAARLRQEEIELGNLDPGSKGYLPDLAVAGGSLLAKKAKGGVVDGLSSSIPRYADGGVIKLGERRTPISKGDLDAGRVLAQSIIGFVGAMKAAQQGPEQGQPASAVSAPMNTPLAATSAPVTSPTQVDPSLLASLGGLPVMAKGGISKGPETALVGEAGPEVIVDIRGVVDRPTITRLGANGKAQAVIPMNPHQEDDRRRVLKDIVKLASRKRV